MLGGEDYWDDVMLATLAKHVRSQNVARVRAARPGPQGLRRRVEKLVQKKRP